MLKKQCGRENEETFSEEKLFARIESVWQIFFLFISLEYAMILFSPYL